MPYVQLLADFREEVRNVAREEKGKIRFNKYVIVIGLQTFPIWKLLNSKTGRGRLCLTVTRAKLYKLRVI